MNIDAHFLSKRLKSQKTHATQVDRVGVQEPLSQRKHNYKIPYIFLGRKILLIHFGDCERNIFQCLGAEDSTLV
jgi:hypothetical protein